MPLPQGTHPLRDAADRIAWREENAALVQAVNEYNGSDAFLRDMADNIRYYGWLTTGQHRVALRILSEQQGRPVPTVDAAPAVREALTDDAPNIFNGDYTINDGSEHLSYKIHTVQSGTLQGKRIIKRLMGDGRYSGFAFVTTTGHVKVWRRFADDANRNEKYIVWANHLLYILREQVSPETMTQGSDGNAMSLGGTIDGVQYEVQASARCRRCNRTLTNPSSIDSGIGPDCAGRDSNRTVAADQHEPVQPAVTTTPAVSTIVEEVPVEDVPEPVVVVETDEERDARLLREYRLAVRDWTIDQIHIEHVRLCRSLRPQSMDRRRASILYGMMSWYVRARTCRWCGRHDFSSDRGCTNHENNYCPIHRQMDEVVHRDAVRRRAEAQAARAQTVVTRGPNLSALGTVIGGQVWVQ